MDGIAGVFGRLHPLVLHFPIGFIVFLGVLTLVASRGGLGLAHGKLRALAWVSAGSAILAASSGYVLSYEDDYGSDAIENHERLGIAIAIVTTLAALLWKRPVLARVLVLLAVALLLPAGHLGSTITHGEGWLSEPLAADAAEPTPPAPDAPPPSFYESRIAPLLAAKCTSCHGERKHKAGLALHRPETIRAGGENGPVLGAGDGTASELLRRLRLALDAEDHMPPPNKAQPSAEEIALIEAWITVGAPFEGDVDTSKVAAAQADAPVEIASAAPVVAPASDDAIRALQDALVHVQPLAQDSPLLWIDFAAVAVQTGDAEVARLLAPVAEQTAELALSRSGISDAALATLAGFPRLRRLDLRSTAVTDAGLAHLAQHAALEELVLVECKLSDAAVDALLVIPSLRKVHLWRSGLSPEGLGRLRAARPSLDVVAGDELDAAIVEAEGEIVFSSERALPGEEGKALAPSLEPVNTICPVSGSPVDRAYAILFRGRVIGFCCPNCPKTFWGDPAQFESKLP